MNDELFDVSVEGCPRVLPAGAEREKVFAGLRHLSAVELHLQVPHVCPERYRHFAAYASYIMAGDGFRTSGSEPILPKYRIKLQEPRQSILPFESNIFLFESHLVPRLSSCPMMKTIVLQGGRDPSWIGTEEPPLADLFNFFAKTDLFNGLLLADLARRAAGSG